MKSKILANWMTYWGLSQVQAANVLCVSPSKVSEWISDTNTRKAPAYVLAHIATFELLSKTKAEAIIKNPLNGKKTI
jgi:predicted transcriptional regulator